MIPEGLNWIQWQHCWRRVCTWLGSLLLALTLAWGWLYIPSAVAVDYNREFLVSADFSGKDLTDNSFTKANLRGANFSASNLRGVSFLEPIWKGPT